MHSVSCVLAERPNFGRIYDCGACGNIHVTIGPVSITMEPQAYLNFVEMVHSSAAAFEAWLQRRESSRCNFNCGETPDEA